MRGLSIRARITIGSVIIASLLLTGALMIVRAQMAGILSEADAGLARGDLNSFQQDIASDPTAEVDDPGTGVLVLVRNPEGDAEVNTLPHDVDAVVGNREATDEEFAFTDDEGRVFVVVGRIVRTSAGDWALWSARSTSSSELAIAGLDRILVVGGLLLLLGFGAASWILTSVALRPVARMRRRADSLGTTLDGDLPEGRANDELAALARTLNEMLARLRAASAREKQMISDAAHELRTPLASLTTQLELAHGDAGDAAALAEHLRGSEASVARLVVLASNLLELNRLDATGARGESASSAQLVDELMGSVDRARLIALARSVDVGIDSHGEDLDRRYALDPQAFGRILDNLLSNAVSAVSDGGSVEVDLSQDADGLRVVVTDDGPGMPPEFLGRAFERFSRPDAGRSGSGSGLGLALVEAIVTSAAGTVTLRNLSPGFEVAVRLPQM
ncbi:MAG: HAMP domain-containing sensor histidine kinase [Pseudolysinimonas sp.]